MIAAAALVVTAQPKFRALVLFENGGHHVAYSKRAMIWLDDLAAKANFAIDRINTPDQIDEDFLKKYKLFIQLDYPPYGWKPRAAAAFQDYIVNGKGGWIGFHHAGLVGAFDGFPVWTWYSVFMGGILWKDYIPTFAKADVQVEDKNHPIMEGVPIKFPVMTEEWYTWDKNPRPNVHVIANVDESSYQPDSKIKMGDHPVIWSNLHVKARNAYVFMGHSPDLFDNEAYLRLFRNAIFWAADVQP